MSGTSNSKTGVAPRRVLCLHGWRTSGRILSLQTSAMSFHTPLEYTFIDAPFPAEGPPDKGIALYYPNRPYFEWYLKRPGSEPPYAGFEVSDEYILKFIREHGPFDGLLGFSQGASIITRLATMQQQRHSIFHGETLFNFVILIGGIPPRDTKLEGCTRISIPSLHIMGTNDPLHRHSEVLVEYYESTMRTVLEHREGHNIPSLGTGLYPQISDWVKHLSE